MKEIIFDMLDYIKFFIMINLTSFTFLNVATRTFKIIHDLHFLINIKRICSYITTGKCSS